MILPNKFKTRMQSVLGDSYESFIESFDKPALKGIRLSTSKFGSERHGEILSDLGQKAVPVPWCSCGYYYEGETSGRDPYYHCGVYYPQEPSAMLPAEILHAEPGDIVLDLCAAPGGKACRIGEDLNGKGLLVANEINSDRSKALNRNIERSGITNCIILNESPQRIASKLPGFFDKILIDAPCSGEGMFRRDPRAVKSWEDYGPEEVSKLQFEIITEAAKCLKPGGEIVYSTCTFAEIEDEQLINRFLEQNDDFVIIPHPEIKGISHDDKGFMRIWPHKAEGDGHFCVHLKNTSKTVTKVYDLTPVAPRSSSLNKSLDKIMSYLGEFINDDGLKALRECCISSLMVNGSGLYLMPVDFRLFDGLRIVKSGLFIGELKTTRTDHLFVPSNSFPLTLNRKMIRDDSIISFDRDDIELEKYLKGETIFLEDDRFGSVKSNGTVVISVKDFPLGLGKINGISVKNMYSKAWRLL